MGLRIVSGAYGGRLIDAPAGADTRPTAERVREALFSSIAAHIPGAAVLDLYAGSGALALEALSRGARHAVLVEKHPAAQRVIAGNIAKLGCDSAARLLGMPDERALALLRQEGARFDVVFLDPPYRAGRYEAALAALCGLLAPEALVAVEHPARMSLAPPGYAIMRQRSYGDSALTLLTEECP